MMQQAQAMMGGGGAMPNMNMPPNLNQ